MEKVESQHGRWFVKTGQKTIKPLEKEIVIELPMSRSEWQRIALLENFAKNWEEHFSNSKENLYRICLEKLKETRTLRIKGKNVDEIDLQKISKLIQQANEKSPIAHLRGIFKGSKREPLITSSNGEKSEHTNNNERMSSET